MLKIKRIIISALIAVLCVLLVVFSAEVGKSVSDSINICISVIIPSMFAYMVISSYLISTGLSKIISKPFYLILKSLIRLDEEDFSIFLMSLFGGYPIGAKLLKEKTAENKNYYAISEKMMAFCYCISPAFAVTVLGYGVFGCIDAGIIIYISNVLACITCAVVLSHLYSLKSSDTLILRKNGIINAINSSTSSLALISSVIISFNILLTVIKELAVALGFNLDTMLLGVVEISNLTKISNVTPSFLPLVSAIASFGGICVLCQCVAICKNTLGVKVFLIARIPCSLLSGLYTAIIMNFWEVSVETGFSPNYNYSFSSDKLVVFVLIFMSVIIFIKTENFFKKV